MQEQQIALVPVEDEPGAAARLIQKIANVRYTYQVVNIVSLIGDYASTTILLNVADQHVRPRDRPLLPI